MTRARTALALAPVALTALLLALAAFAAVRPAPAAEGPRAGSAADDAGAGGSMAATGADSDGVAVVELFTSQGCSSCPPADRLLSELAADPALGGRVFPLAFHVDYWNYIGWQDPFSSSRFSQRQRRYARALQSTVYTPQAVVNGRFETVGSRRREVGEAVREALATPPAVAVELHLEAGPDSVAAEVAARRAPDAAGRPAELWLALFQDGLETPVTRGENADRRLANDRVVRRFERALRLAAGAARGSARVELAIEPGWERQSLGVVALVQDPESLEILGAAGDRLGD